MSDGITRRHGEVRSDYQFRRGQEAERERIRQIVTEDIVDKEGSDEVCHDAKVVRWICDDILRRLEQ